MELASVVVFVLVVLALSVGRLLDSLAYRNRAQGKAAVLRAQQSPAHCLDGTGEHGRSDV
ncbi:hypothetical protein ACIBKX_36890 [Streptomyces sp. NPDC050658]|uniref:hypothetical protein n=1 Tax=unclassified Streptomyces TaxID=2593676 RepID=UPI003426F3A3